MRAWLPADRSAGGGADQRAGVSGGRGAGLRPASQAAAAAAHRRLQRAGGRAQHQPQEVWLVDCCFFFFSLFSCLLFVSLTAYCVPTIIIVHMLSWGLQGDW